MVSKGSEDLPEPESPVTTVRVLRGMATEMLRRLCWRAPRTVMWVIAMRFGSDVRAHDCDVSDETAKLTGYGISGRRRQDRSNRVVGQFEFRGKRSYRKPRFSSTTTQRLV